MNKLRTVTVYGLVALALIFGAAALPGMAADHLDAPGLTSPGGDGRLDINDIYAFQSPTNPDNTVLIMTVNPLAGALSPTTFHPKARYEFLIDSDGDAEEDAKIKISFGKPDADGVQRVRLKGPGIKARGYTGDMIPVSGGGMLWVGLADAPFFFDLFAFLGADFDSKPRSFCDGSEFDFFAGFNVSAIVLELPSAMLLDDDDDDDDDDNGDSDSVIGVWARTKMGGQVDRMGLPAINTVFIPANPFEPDEPSQKNAYNAGKPENDQEDFRGEIVDTLLLLGNDEDTANALANVLLPDIMPFDTASAAGFLNGRQLDNDVFP